MCSGDAGYDLMSWREWCRVEDSEIEQRRFKPVGCHVMLTADFIRTLSWLSFCCKVRVDLVILAFSYKLDISWFLICWHDAYDRVDLLHIY